MNFPIKHLLILTIAALPLAALAASHSGGAPMVASPAAPAAATATDMTAAEVRKVDKAGGKLTLKHEAIKNLDMPGMTMVFQVKDKAVLDTLKAGDKVKFKAISDAGKYTVTEIQADK